MNPILRNTLAVLAGCFIGSVINMGIIQLGMNLIPPPEGVDPTDVESIKASMHLYETKHFIVPWIAHAIGTLVAAFIAVKFAVSHHLKLAMGIGAFFLLGGVAAAQMIGSPALMTAIDLIVAYLPMAWLGYQLAYSNADPSN
ncbi:MAG: hypothetical protein AAF985_02845 [Bacteroidota bacterium]